MFKNTKMTKIFPGFILVLLLANLIFAQTQAEVIVTSTYLRKAPAVTAEKVRVVQKGEKITLEKSHETAGWFFVSTANGTAKGWIRRDTLSSPEKVKNVSVAAAQENPATVVKPANDVSQPKTATAATPKPTPNADDEEILRVDTEEVRLNVRVVDDNNRKVTNLNLSQFKVYEDGVLQPLESIGTVEIPVIDALLIDTSRSLRAQLGKIIEAGKIIVNTNRPNDQTEIVRFISKDKIEVAQDFTSSKYTLNNALDNLFVEGGQTAIIDAVYQTAKKVEEYQKSTSKEDIKLRALILVSDGDDRSSTLSEAELFALLRQSQVQIYVIGFVNELSKEADAGGVSRQQKAKSFLTRLAEETGGKVYFPNSMDDLLPIAKNISDELRTQYSLTYTPTNETRDGKFRKIRVEVADGANREKRTAVTRAGRIVAPK